MDNPHSSCGSTATQQYPDTTNPASVEFLFCIRGVRTLRSASNATFFPYQMGSSSSPKATVLVFFILLFRGRRPTDLIWPKKTFYMYKTRWKKKKKKDPNVELFF
ncbi:hypothetical protein OUZ56_019921 [Daphnia magna]|uniref:Uncharacterized protein n=1 Tax=Daphnia magna TaxID=35525 RepID=A0ABQ9ZD37_9CRUS|nr:hypothetical protein OUZ56_019921 [Daphnia magna]